ncbi:MAG TPA: response regulator [Vicinamibacterales bacterium]|jgi:two-component system response regulator MprA|nr:response regulator [Vicinamibacterales bacterium]
MNLAEALEHQPPGWLGSSQPYEAPDPAPANPPKSTTPAKAGSGSILIVDDDESVTQSFARILTLEGYTVAVAKNGEAGLERAAAARPDAIILDLRMPLVDGLSFLRRLRATDTEHQIPVAIVTGDYFLEDGISIEVQRLGASLRFKPLWLEDLVGLARTLLPKVTH